MLMYVKTDLFESPAQVLVNTVNTVGVMGKGIAKQFKDIYPEMFKQYQELCEKKMLEPGKLWIYKTPNKWILNFPTKKHWRSPSKIEYIEAGLEKFVNTYAEKGITSISFPLLGCGNGGLDWETEVQPVMEKYLRPLPIDIFIHLPNKKNEDNKKEHYNIKETKKWLRATPALLSFNEVKEDLTELINSCTKLRVGDIEYTIAKNENNDEVTILFESAQKSYTLSDEQLMDLWKTLRSVGFCLKQGLPSGLFEFGNLIFSFLCLLPYIEPVNMAHRFSNNDDLEVGIRLVPYMAKKTPNNTDVEVAVNESEA